MKTGLNLEFLELRSLCPLPFVINLGSTETKTKCIENCAWFLKQNILKT